MNQKRKDTKELRPEERIELLELLLCSITAYSRKLSKIVEAHSTSLEINKDMKLLDSSFEINVKKIFEHYNLESEFSDE